MKNHEKQIERVDRAVTAYQRWQQAESIRQTIPTRIEGKIVDGVFKANRIEDTLVHMYRMQVFCGLVYVTLESYMNLGEKDTAVERTAPDKFRKRLKVLRNVMFHDGRGQMFEKRWVKFYQDGRENIERVHQLHQALGLFLDHQYIREACRSSKRRPLREALVFDDREGGQNSDPSTRRRLRYASPARHSPSVVQ